MFNMKINIMSENLNTYIRKFKVTDPTGIKI